MIYYETNERLIEESKKRGVKTTNKGLLYFNTGKYTGRSPKDRYFVYGEYTNKVIDFDRPINQGISQKTYNELKNKLNDFLNNKKTFESKRIVGAEVNNMVSFRLKSSEPHYVLFFNNMTIDITKMVSTFSRCLQQWDILHAPDFLNNKKFDDLKSENFVIINFEEKIVLIGGTGYTGEIKKSMFTIMNTIMVDKGVFPMHCSANANTKIGKGINLFFGLSGTGKTTLSSDLNKYFIGDDEHGWDGNKIFNFEGGCYAKLINLEKEKEPIIWDAMHSVFTKHNTTLLENVIVNEGEVDYTDSSVTENIRVSYPLDQIKKENKVTLFGRGLEVENIFFLSFDAFGVLPPISLLSNEMAVKYFGLGYTSKVAGTEVGVNEPTTTFSSCFGNPFLPRRIEDYTNMFEQKLRENPRVKVWLVNTGFDKHYNRFSLSQTRGVINGVIDREYEEEYIEYNELLIPKRIGEYNMEEVFEKPDEIRQGKFFTLIKNSL